MPLKKRMPGLVAALVMFSPVLDVMTSLAANLGVPVTIGTVVRTAMMLLAAFYVVFLAKFDRKPAVLGAMAVYMAYGLLFVANLYRLGGPALCVSNVQATAKTFFTPVMALCLYALYRENGWTASARQIAAAGATYTSVILVAYLTGTGFTSYTDSGYGSCGWFYAANEIGCIVAITAPLVLYYVAAAITENRTRRTSVLLTIAAMSVVFAANFIGTKVVYGITLLYAALAALWFGIDYKKNGDPDSRTRCVLMAAVTAMIVGFYAVSPLARYLSDVYLELFKPNSPLRAISQSEDVAVAASGSALKALMDSNPILDKIDQLLSRRLLTASSSVQVWMDADLETKLLGIGYVTAPSYGRNISFMIEMDFLAILVRHGIAGFAIYALPYLLFIITACRRFLKDFKTCWASFRHCTYLYAVLAGFGIALIAGHALVSPAVALFVLATCFGLHDEMRAPVKSFTDVPLPEVAPRLPEHRERRAGMAP